MTNPAAPSILSATPVEVPVVNGVAGTPGSSNGHIASCIQSCRYLWTTGSEEGLTVFDLADPARRRHLGAFTVRAGRDRGGLAAPRLQRPGLVPHLEDHRRAHADGTQRLSLLDLWTTELNELQRGDGRSNPLGLPTTVNCSAHWFDEDRGIVAQGWYDQGVRFLDMRDPRDIKQVGYYVSAGTFWAAYYAPTDPSGEIVYALDTAGGIDVLRIDRTRSGSVVRAPVSDGMKQPSRARAHATFGLACPLPS